MIYEVKFKWRGTLDTQQDRMIDWLEARGKDPVCAFTTFGDGIVFLETLYEIGDLERDLGVTVFQVKRAEEQELELA